MMIYDIKLCQVLGGMFLLSCTDQSVGRRAVGVVDGTRLPVVFFTAAKCAYDMSMKSFFLRLLLCTLALF